MSLVKLQNEMILASAGSGKTYQLTNRYIGLMALSVDPERIIALTFTRKAAGEFFDSILEKLADAASDAAKCAELAGNIKMPELGRGDFQVLLRKFVDRMHLLTLGTLDSFFVEIVRNFPFEFGLSGVFDILDEHLAAAEKDRVYRHVFQRPERRAAQRRDFLEAFKQATFGREEESLLTELNRFVDDNHAIYLAAPEESKWGNWKTVWPRGALWLGTTADLRAEFARLFEEFGSAGLSDKQWERWEAFAEAAAKHDPGNTFAPGLEFLLGKLLAIWPGIENEDAVLRTDRQQLELSPEACEIIHRIVTHLVGAELVVRLERTKGIWTVLSRYESAYSRLVRRRGKLTFNDLQLILAGAETGAALDADPAMPPQRRERPLLSQTPGPENRLQIDYRLDARFDHWLLDEFQDTNYLQWSIVENLIDEAMQDTSGQRSLFQVGDIKQAIYAWRGGDTKLFYEIRDHYNRYGEKRIVERPLNDSWRSGPAVIDMVNRVFGDDSVLRDVFPAKAVDRWRWGPHVSRHPDWNGYAALLNPRAADADGKLEAGDRHALAVAILEEIQPAKNHLSCAILVQTNQQGREVVDFVRAHTGIPVLNEADVSVANDGPLTVALLSLLRFAAHPGDLFHWWHLKMTPFDAVFEKHGLDRGRIVAEITRDIHRHGFEATLQHWIAELANIVPVDAYNRRRAGEFLLAARDFDQTGSRDIDEFLGFAGRYTVREPETRGVVQVMTIHKAKGLGFDVVILPELGGKTLTEIRRGIGVQRNERREVDWVLSIPPKEIANADAVLRQYREEQEVDACFEALCKFYVAMTRAKRAMYLITDPVGKSGSRNFPKLLEKTLRLGAPAPLSFAGRECDAVFQTGKKDWQTLIKKETSASSSKTSAPSALKPRPATPATTPTRRRPLRRTPSGSETHTVTARQLFSRTGKRARDYGTAVHALFEQIAWLDQVDDTAAHYETWERAAKIPDTLRDQVRQEVLACLETPEVRQALSQKKNSAISASSAVKTQLWRERRFEILLENDWLSGTFDRVVIEPGENSATILDFKTDRINPSEDDAFEKKVAGYRPQLETYRRVLARMTGLEESAIKCRLLFTKLRRIVDL